MPTGPAGPIQLLSKANFRKYETPIKTAAIPIRFSQCEPMRDSRSPSGSSGVVRTGLAGMAGRGNVGATGAVAGGDGADVNLTASTTLSGLPTVEDAPVSKGR